jgi:D-serine deaminase-like pyridoxal phosphate-dependent protein
MQGCDVRDLRTPALLLDLEAMERNLDRMSCFYTKSEVKLRPHFKNHRVLALAWMQMKAGAIGITCASLTQAELLVNFGIENILVANEIVDTAVIKAFAELSHHAPVIVAVDDAKVVDEMAWWSRKEQVELNVVTDVDIRLGRCGVKPGEAVRSLSKRALEKGLKLRELMGYEGHVQSSLGSEKDRVVRTALQSLVNCRRQLESSGIAVEIVSCGGTGDYEIAGAFPGVTENQAGSYLLMDTWYKPDAPDFSPALSILSTVISKTPGERIVVNAGRKVNSGELGLPSIKHNPALQLRAMHAEHAIIDIKDPSVPVDVGDKIEIWVHYHDGTVNLHDRMYGIRNNKVEETFTIAN